MTYVPGSTVVVTLYDANGIHGTMLTDTNGLYLFDGLPTGDYQVFSLPADPFMPGGAVYQMPDPGALPEGTYTHRDASAGPAGFYRVRLAP